MVGKGKKAGAVHGNIVIHFRDRGIPRTGLWERKPRARKNEIGVQTKKYHWGSSSQRKPSQKVKREQAGEQGQKRGVQGVYRSLSERKSGSGRKIRKREGLKEQQRMRGTRKDHPPWSLRRIQDD